MLTPSRLELVGVAVDDIIDDAPGRSVRLKEVDDIADTICAQDASVAWERDVEISLGAKRWRPSGVSATRDRLLYVFLQDELPRFVADRLRFAEAAGIGVTVALNLASLYRPEVVELLVASEAEVLVLDDYNEQRRLEHRSVLAALADVEVPVAPDVRRLIAGQVWPRIGDGTKQQKGRRLEALLAFLFAQVQDLKVVERNYRNESEEIDLVLQVDNFSPRVWQKPGVPFILVEAKNWKAKATQQVVSVLITKLQTKRSAARIAVLIAMGGFTEDARIQELRFSSQDLCVVMIDRAQLETLLFADDLDQALETIVRQALLR